MDKKAKLGLVGLAALFVFFVAFRQFYQKGAKLLADLFPWNWIALVVILVLLGWYAYRVTHKKDGKKEEIEENSGE